MEQQYSHVHIYDRQPVIWKWTHGGGHLVVECETCHMQNLMIQEKPAYTYVLPNDDPDYGSGLPQPIDLERDSTMLINGLMEVGRTASTLVSRAAVEKGTDDPVTEMLDNVAQRITLALLEFQIALKVNE